MVAQHRGLALASIDTLASVGYRETLRQQYTKHGWGATGRTHAGAVIDWAKELGAQTAIDYGCGRCTLSPLVTELAWQEYDPGIVGKDIPPNVPADLVVATDVLEHIERDRVDVVLTHIRSLAIKGGYFAIALSLAALTLPDGRNAHLTVENSSWWIDRLMSVGFDIVRIQHKKGLRVWTR